MSSTDLIPAFLSSSLRLRLLCLLLSLFTSPLLLKNQPPILHFLALATLITLLLFPHRRHVYLLDYSCLRPPSHLRVPTAAFIEHLSLLPSFDPSSVAFMSKVLTSSGLGEETCLPPSLHSLPPSTLFRDSISEAHLVLFPVLDNLFSKTNILPSLVDLLILNCSGFCPSPSLSSIVVNHFRMREDVKSYNLSGMGCSASIIALDIARGFLSVHPNSYAVILSTEILSTGWYPGTDNRKLLINCVFRMGSAAALLTNKPEERRRAKYKLSHLLRWQRASDDASYRSAMLDEDAKGLQGFSLERDIIRVFRETVHASAVSLGASILPLREKARYVVFLIRRALSSRKRSGGGDEGGVTYVPDFSLAINHYFVPASSVTMVREIGKGLGLRERDMEPVLATFQRFGNQSSSSTWYQIAYVEARGRMKKGDKVWQLGIGSGLKGNSAVWVCLRGVSGEEEEQKGPWSGCVDRYPMQIVR